MADLAEYDSFFDELLHILMNVDLKSADIEHHVDKMRALIENHKAVDKYAEKLSHFNDTELEAMLRFVEKPKGRHHIGELRNFLKEWPAHEVGVLFLRHFYKHEGEHLPNGHYIQHV